jgi:hypothetical protein
LLFILKLGFRFLLCAWGLGTLPQFLGSKKVFQGSSESESILILLLIFIVVVYYPPAQGGVIFYEKSSLR